MTPEQLERLIDEHHRALELFASQWTAWPEDCVQEAFLSMHRHNQVIQNHKAWLFRVVRNLAIDAGRSESSRRQREQASAKRRQWFVESAGTFDPLELQTALKTLELNQREVVVARIWGKLTLSEIAEAFGIAVSTAHRRYENGIVQLQKYFQACENL